MIQCGQCLRCFPTDDELRMHDCSDPMLDNFRKAAVLKRRLAERDQTSKVALRKTSNVESSTTTRVESPTRDTDCAKSSYPIRLPPAAVTRHRTKSERAKLIGYDCPCCEKYYDALGLDEEAKAAHINLVSRHRYDQPRPRTPPFYWETDFPSDAECQRRGYVNKSSEPYFFKSKRAKKEALMGKSVQDQSSKNSHQL